MNAAGKDSAHGEYICGECNITFATEEKLEEHVEQVHGGEL